MNRIVITGGPVDGFTVYGPFATADDAADWATDESLDDWWVHTIHEPEAASGTDPDPDAVWLGLSPAAKADWVRAMFPLPAEEESP